jgi:hypothetical protein
MLSACLRTSIKTHNTINTLVYYVLITDFNNKIYKNKSTNPEYPKTFQANSISRLRMHCLLLLFL